MVIEGEWRAPGASNASASPRSPRSPEGEQLYLKACAAGIGYLFALAFSKRRSAPSSPLVLLRSPPCLLFAIPAASSTRISSTRCVASWGGPHRSSPGRSGQARAPSTTWSRGSSSSSTRTPPTGWCLRSPPPSSYPWRSSIFSSSTSPPTLYSSWPSSPLHGDVHGGPSLRPHLQAFLRLVGQGRASARSAPTTSSSGMGCPAPTSAPSPAPSGKTGAMTGSSP
jgi:hypothetical protein